MTWWDFLESLRDYLRGYAGLDGVLIELGDNAAVPEVATVALMRGPVEPPSKQDTVPGNATLPIECWQYATDAEEGYRLLATLEATVRDALLAWAASEPFAGFELKAVLPAWQPDGDMFRPSVGSRTEMVVRFRPRPI